ncbi:MAG: hypothetical protein AVDCRST_MAG15-484, partial [uncultured Rubellimicrobium sp.]
CSGSSPKPSASRLMPRCPEVCRRVARRLRPSPRPPGGRAWG